MIDEGKQATVLDGESYHNLMPTIVNWEMSRTGRPKRNVLRSAKLPDVLTKCS